MIKKGSRTVAIYLVMRSTGLRIRNPEKPSIPAGICQPFQRFNRPVGILQSFVYYAAFHVRGHGDSQKIADGGRQIHHSHLSAKGDSFADAGA